MKNFNNLALSFPELEDSVKQSTKGGWGGYSDGGGGGSWWSNFNPNKDVINLPEVHITPNGGSYDPGNSNGNYTPGGNPYWNGGSSNNGNAGYGDQGGSSGGGNTGGDAHSPLPTFNKDVVDVVETYHSALENTNDAVKDAAEIAGRIGDAEQAAQAVKQLKAIGEVLGHVGKATALYDTYVAISDGKVTLKEATKLIADIAIGEVAGAIPIAGPIIAIVYTALDATGQVDKFIDWVYPDKMEDEGIDELWDRLMAEGATEGKTFLETFGRITPNQQAKQDMQDAFHSHLIS